MLIVPIGTETERCGVIHVLAFCLAGGTWVGYGVRAPQDTDNTDDTDGTDEGREYVLVLPSALVAK